MKTRCNHGNTVNSIIYAKRNDIYAGTFVTRITLAPVPKYTSHCIPRDGEDGGNYIWCSGDLECKVNKILHCYG